ncbi:uncharacterized protein FIBRA_02985 [Fibroporia radiculosa]|uniref:RNA-dependent RNA polymerase n=1 Tax=Fibroporia radiculosa TaxID=599839 RepID=J4G3Q4_9APHY|nr:uncharacterized protein FIBRA_02985 [Fibroporia radiculosa]CCM00938.1 predicted protein [Fibroporia radiculosa]
MDIFMRNIAFAVSSRDLKAHLAVVLHGPEFLRPGENPINFEVRIFRSQQGRGPPVGFLTLPTEEIGARFLKLYGEPAPSQTITMGRRIVFKRSNRQSNPDVLDNVRRRPFVHPREVQEREDRDAERQSMSASIKTIQFGWVCRDDVYSVEWEKQCIHKATLVYDEDAREFRIKAEDLDDDDRMPITRTIGFRAAQMYWTSATIDNLGDPAIFFHLNHPPSFESESDTHLTQLFSRLVLGRERQPPTRRRWESFTNEHVLLAPFTSLAIRIICKRMEDLQTYRNFCRVAQRKVDDSAYPIVRRSLFGQDTLTVFFAWLSHLEWSVAFQVEALARSHLMDLRELISLRPEIEETLRDQGAGVTSAILRDFLSRVKAIFWFGEKNQEHQDSVQALFAQSRRDWSISSLLLQETSVDNFNCFHVVVTPTTMYLEGPFPERSNRIMRMYMANQDSFLRVSFVEENRLMYRFDRELDARDFVNRRVKHLLLNGLTIAGRHFDFLAYSQSALKEHAVWFVKPFNHTDRRQIDAATIISGLGSFHDLAFDERLIYCPARYAARISQAFTATDSSVSVEAEEVVPIPDIWDATHTYSFTDGVGTISPDLAQAIWDELRAKQKRSRHRTKPRAYQVRFMGSKGMLSVDYRLENRLVCLRESMIKFDAPNSLFIEIARAFDKPGRYYLNRPLIMLLEGLGVPYSTFQALQDAAVQNAQDSVESLSSSARLLEAHGLGTSFRLTSTMLSLHRLGLGPLHEDIFWQQMMDFAVNHVLRELKHHARIPVPDGWTLVGVADVHGFLNEGEIFACVHPQDSSVPIYLEGPTLISRSPTIHPGDVQVVHAIGPPPPGSPFEKEPLPNTVVFSIKGGRPLPSYLGGGDLDGDVYNLTTMPSMRPRRTYPPARYDPAPKKFVDHPSTMADVAEFVAEYIISDTLGIIAINWLITADQSGLGIFDPDCLKLAQLHSDAVDYPKSGIPVALDQIPRLKRKSKPDWNAPETITKESTNWYESTRAIGHLFRAIELPALQTVKRASRYQRRHLSNGDELNLDDILAEFRSVEPHRADYFQLTIEHRISEFIPLPEEGDVDEVDEAAITRTWELLRAYGTRLRAICADHTLSHTRSAMLTEEEVVVGTIVANCAQPRKRKDLMSQMREQTATLVNSVRVEISGDDDTPAEESLRRAWIAYKVALIDPDYFGARSFTWIAMGEIFDAIRDIEAEDRKLLR